MRPSLPLECHRSSLQVHGPAQRVIGSLSVVILSVSPILLPLMSIQRLLRPMAIPLPPKNKTLMWMRMRMPMPVPNLTVLTRKLLLLKRNLQVMHLPRQDLSLLPSLQSCLLQLSCKLWRYTYGNAITIKVQLDGWFSHVFIYNYSSVKRMRDNESLSRTLPFHVTKIEAAFVFISCNRCCVVCNHIILKNNPFQFNETDTTIFFLTPVTRETQ
mmetsp:Transcript_5420/g.11625  ORF Transcript_5420/g.11625 Transcript_5420/m.11625 type:complete len:214 (+) Transcript_5420:1885-2526(+)